MRTRWFLFQQKAFRATGMDPFVRGIETFGKRIKETGGIVSFAEKKTSIPVTIPCRNELWGMILRRTKNKIQIAHLPEEVRGRLQSDFRLLADYMACKGEEAKLDILLSDDRHPIRHPEEFLDALSAVTGDSRYGEIKVQIQDREETEVVTMCVLADKLEKRGMEKGLEKGIAVLIMDYAEDGKTKQQILDKLKLRFQLSRDEAEHYYQKYLMKP